MLFRSKKHKYVHWDFHTDNLFIDTTNSEFHVPVFFDFDQSTIAIEDKPYGSYYGESEFLTKKSEYEEGLQDKQKEIKLEIENGRAHDILIELFKNEFNDGTISYNEKDLKDLLELESHLDSLSSKSDKEKENEFLIIGLLHDEVRFLFEKYHYSNDKAFRSRYLTIIKQIFRERYNIELSDALLCLIIYIINKSGTNNYIIECILMLYIPNIILKNIMNY